MRKLATLAVAALATATIPAIAADEQAVQSAYTAELADRANAEQVRKLLNAQNYKNVSILDRDEDGRWTGTAVKDGKSTFVSVYLPTKADVDAIN